MQRRFITASSIAVYAAAMGAMGLARAAETPATASDVIEEVVVTANKRAESAQKVDIAITAFSGDQMRELGVAQPKDLSSYVPNLNAKNATGGENPIFTLRGVGISAFVGNANPSVGVYVDEVYLPTNMLMSFSVLDVAHVEVLKGPQGTLFGRNTTAGAVTFTSAVPSRELDGYVRTSYGNYDHFKMEAAIGGPLTSTLAGRFAIKQDSQGQGWYQNELNGQTVGKVQTTAFRGSLMYQPSDATTALWSVHGGIDLSETHPWDHVGLFDINAPTADPRYPGGQYYGGSGAFGFPLRCPGGDGSGNSDALQASGQCVDRSGYKDTDGDPFKGRYNGSFKMDNRGLGSVLRITHDLDAAQLVSVTGWEHYSRDSNEEFDSGPSTLAEPNYTSKIDVYQQELRLVSKASEPLGWIVGAFYSHDDNVTDDLYRYANRFLADLRVAYKQQTDAEAVFGQLGWSFAKNLKLNAGLRYSSERTSFKGGTSVVNPIAATTDFFGFNSQGVLTNANKSTSNSALSGKVGLDWTPVDDVMVYGSVSQGFKSGGFSGFWTFSDEETNPYGKETLTDYEFGVKSRFDEGRMQLNAATFLYDYKGLQLFALNTRFAFVLINANKARVSGAEVDWRYRPVAGLDLGLALGYINQAKITEFVTTGFLNDFNGKELPDTSKLTGTGSIAYEWPAFGTNTLRAEVLGSYRSAKYTQIDNLNLDREPASFVADARLSLNATDNRWSLALWSKNIADRRYYQEKIFIANAGVANRLPAAPREFGVEFSYRVK